MNARQVELATLPVLPRASDFPLTNDRTSGTAGKV